MKNRIGIWVVATALTTAVASGHARGRDDALEALPEASFSFEDARHLLMRAGFGGTHEEVQRLHRLGLRGMVDWLIDYDGRPDVVGPHFVERGDPIDFRRFRQMSEDERRRVRRRIRREDQQRFNLVRRWWVERMVQSRRPLEEKMTLFWHGHFTSSYRDVRSAARIHEQNELLRQHATGNFGELLHAISKDPAMLDYLDNNQNRKGRPNENYAREVMELFTLGVGNYTEKDIKEAARAFTGWTFARRNGRFVNNRFQHDFGRKTIFGKSGRYDGDDVCRLLLEHEACAPYIAGKLFSWFAYDGADKQLVAELANHLKRCRFELRPLLRKIFMSRAFYSDKAKGAQVKSPIVLLVSTVRMLGMTQPPADLLIGGAQRLGQALLMPPNVKGWEGGLAWITTASMLERNNFCGMLLGTRPASDARRRGRTGMVMSGRDRARQRARRDMQRWSSGFRASSLAEVIGARSAAELVDGFASRLLFAPLADDTRQKLIRFVESGGDTTNETKLRKLIHLIMSTPEFQVC